MHCTKCGARTYRGELYYHPDTFTIECRECCPDGIPYNKIEHHLELHFPDMYELLNKAFSTRLPLEHLIYFLKYAKTERTKTISNTFIHMIERLMESHPLNDETLEEIPLSNYSKGNKLTSPFLTEKEIKKEEITLDIPKPVIDIDGKYTDDDEEVFTI